MSVDAASEPAPGDGPPEAFFHEDSGAVRFWVRTHLGGYVGAIVRKEILHVRYRAAVDGSDALAVYAAHRREIDAAVLRRIAEGSIEPVLLREANL